MKCSLNSVLRCVGLASISCDRSDQLSGHTPDAARTIVKAIIACRLDWCNSLLYGVPENLLRKVQSVQNAATRSLISARRCDHIHTTVAPVLPVQRRVEFKIACLVHQSLASLAPTYLTTDVHLVSEYGRRPLRSPTDRTLTVPRTHNRFGDRSFAVAGPRLWNSLPISLRQISSFGLFRRYLINHLFWI